MALASDGFFSYTWALPNGENIPLTVAVRDISEAQQKGLELLDEVYDYEKTLHYRKAIQETKPVLVGPYTGPIFY